MCVALPTDTRRSQSTMLFDQRDTKGSPSQPLPLGGSQTVPVSFTQSAAAVAQRAARAILSHPVPSAARASSFRPLQSADGSARLSEGRPSSAFQRVKPQPVSASPEAATAGTTPSAVNRSKTFSLLREWRQLSKEERTQKAADAWKKWMAIRGSEISQPPVEAASLLQLQQRARFWRELPADRN
jgi:hypothetical protein